MNNSALITVYIPTYNRGRYLKRALTCMRLQTLARSKFRVVVADNFSNDNTAEVVKEFSDLNIVYLRRDENIGLFGNWLGASSFFETPYFHFLSDDDLLAPFHLEFALNKLEANLDAGLFATGSLYGAGLWEDQIKRTDLRLGDQYLEQRDMCSYWSTEAWLAAHSVSSAVCMNATLFRTRILQEITPLFDDSAAHIADRLFMANVGVKTKCITSPWPTCMLIEHGNNTAHGADSDELDQLKQIVAAKILDIAKKGNHDVISFWKKYFNEAGRNRSEIKYLVHRYYPAKEAEEALGGWIPYVGKIDRLPIPKSAKKGIRALKNSLTGK